MPDSFRSAIELHSNGQLELAAAAYWEIIQLGGYDSECLHHYAICLWQLGDNEGASTWFARSTELAPQNAELWANFGHFLCSQGLGSRGVDACLRATQLAPYYPRAWANLAAAYRSNQRLQDALSACKRALALSPGDSDLTASLAGIYLDMSAWREAKAICDSLLARDPNHLEGVVSSAIAHTELKLEDSAVRLSALAVNIAPSDARCWLIRGRILTKFGNPQASLSCFDRALTIHSTLWAALSAKGEAYLDLRRFDLALECFYKLVESDPSSVGHYLNCASTLLILNRPAEALQLLNSFRVNSADDYRILTSIGNCYRELGMYTEARDLYMQAISMNPNYLEALNNLGSVFYRLRQLDKAFSIFDSIVRVSPTFVDAINNKGVVCVAHGQYQSAKEFFSQAVRLKAEYFDAWKNLADLHFRMGEYSEALDCYVRARTLHHQPSALIDSILHTRLKLCDWDHYTEDTKTLCDSIQRRELICEPFTVLAVSDNLAYIHASASDYAAARLHTVDVDIVSGDLAFDDSVIRVGYFSADFYNHATAYLTAEIFELHDKDSFQIHAFSFGPNVDDDMTKRLKRSFSYFHDVRQLSDSEIALLSRQLKIDIAVDLKGYTQDARPQIFSHRAAPTQIAYLGYPGTLGNGRIDYIIGDEVVIPESHLDWYQESVIWMPHSYQANDSTRKIARPSLSKKNLGLERFGFVYCCFNSHYKIAPAVFSAWMRILKSVPNSCLWLLGSNSAARSNLVRYAELQGVSGERLIFSARLRLDEHLARHTHADLFLDTWPYNAHTTASDALWAGLPVLTLTGNSFSSRVGASLLQSVGLPELITDNLTDYVALAITLGKDPERISRLKQVLESGLKLCPLFDSRRFTRDLEKAFSHVVKRRREGYAPDHVKVRDLK